MYIQELPKTNNNPSKAPAVELKNSRWGVSREQNSPFDDSREAPMAAFSRNISAAGESSSGEGVIKRKWELHHFEVYLTSVLARENL